MLILAPEAWLYEFYNIAPSSTGAFFLALRNMRDAICPF